MKRDKAAQKIPIPILTSIKQKRKKRTKRGVAINEKRNYLTYIYTFENIFHLQLYQCLNFSKKRAKSEDGEIRDSTEEDNKQSHPLVSVTKIDPDEIPEVPANKFLYRAGSTNNANQKEFRQHYGRDRIRSHRKAGRIFKGRGIFVSVIIVLS